MNQKAKQILTLMALIWAAEAQSTKPTNHLRGPNQIINNNAALEIASSSEVQEVLCRLTIMHTSYARVETAHPQTDFEPEETEEFNCIPIVDEKPSDSLYPIALPEQFINENRDQVFTGKMLLTISNAQVTDAGLQLAPNSEFRALREVPSHLRHLVTTTFTTGNRTIAFIRISTEDSTPTYSLADTKNIIQGGNSTIFKQFTECSFGKLNYVMSKTGFMDFKLQGKYIKDFATPELLIQEAEKQLAARYMTASSIANTVVMIVPPGTGSWVGKAPLNHWRAMFNDVWGVSITNLMHELGHLMGLMHAGRDGNVYADTVGYMSWGLRSATYPRKCYNGEKSWDLGWYKDRHLKLTKSTLTPRLITVAAFTDYPLASSSEPVIVNLDDLIFLTYNRMESFNGETEEKQNQVTVHKRLSDRSDALAGLSAGNQYSIANYNGTGKTLYIKACSRTDRSGKADIMTISVGFNKLMC